MGVREHPTRKGWYILDISNGRKAPRDRIPFQGSWEAALTEYNRLRGQRSKYHASSSLIADLVQDFLREYALDHSSETVKNWIYAWKRLAPVFGNISFHHITSELIITYKERRLASSWSPAHNARDAETVKRHAKPITKRTITKELSYLSTFCNWAVDKGYCPQLSFHIRGFKKKDVRPPKPVVLHQGELEKILAQMREPQRTMVTVMHDAGLRRTECYNLTCAQVDLEREVLTITGKGNKERIVPIIGQRLHNALKEAVKERETGYLFPNPRTGKPFKDIRDSFKNAAERSGVNKRLYNHLFRHCFGTGMAAAGVHPTAMKDALGHETFATTDMYVHNAAEFIKSELSKMPQNNRSQKVGKKR
jgi:site-specific recombinase XerD